MSSIDQGGGKRRLAAISHSNVQSCDGALRVDGIGTEGRHRHRVLAIGAQFRFVADRQSRREADTN